jgi:phage-related tail protein
VNKEEIKEKINEVEQAYKKLDDQITQLKENKLRLEGQYGLLKSMLEEDDEKELEEIGD